MGVLILGDGLLGKELSNQTGWDILSRKKDGFDITDPTTFSKILLPYDGITQYCKYNTIINCIANTDTYSKDRQYHWEVNYKGVADLVDFCNEWEIKLVHISTDYVYANSSGTPTEKDVPVHQETHYAHTKLLADGYVELRSNKYLIVRTTHKPSPFPYDKAWLDQIGNFDYVTVIASLIIKLVDREVVGIINVGTQMKSVFELAKQTRKDVLPGLVSSPLIPNNTLMNLDKLTKLNLK
jgi:dTDP-4-dehydrorhamnose reductase